jgi:hypothetical protein
LARPSAAASQRTGTRSRSTTPSTPRPLTQALFPSCCDKLGRIPSEDREENDEGVWPAPVYYQAAHAAEQVIQQSVTIIIYCLFIIEGMRRADYATISDYMTDNVAELRSMLRLFIDHLYYFDMYEGYKEAELPPDVIFLRKLDALLKDQH